MYVIPFARFLTEIGQGSVRAPLRINTPLRSKAIIILGVLLKE